MKPNLDILIGAPGSGKSTFAAHFANNGNTIWISRDYIRFRYLDKNPNAHYFDFENEVYNDFINEIVAALRNNYNAVADATHLNTAARKKLTNAIDKYYTDYNIIYIIFLASTEACIEHNKNRVGHANVPEDVIRDMRMKLTVPNKEDSREIGKWFIEGEV